MNGFVIHTTKSEVDHYLWGVYLEDVHLCLKNPRKLQILGGMFKAVESAVERLVNNKANPFLYCCFISIRDHR